MRYLIPILIILFVNIHVFVKNINNDQLNILFCDVGQGDAIFIQTPNKQQFLIDGGPDNSVDDCISNINPFYNRNLNILAVTHLHADHLTGILTVLRNYNVKTLISDKIEYLTPETQQLRNILKLKNQTTSLKDLWQGDSFNLDKDVEVLCWWPQKTTWNSTTGNWKGYIADFNDSSLVMTIKYHKTIMLFTGDVSTPILDNISNNQQFQRYLSSTNIRIYKASHHGSRGAVSKSMLQIFQPDITVISDGIDNKFQHPHPEAVKLYQEYSKSVHRTDIGQTLYLQTNGYNIIRK